jgi:hypothetical protein
MQQHARLFAHHGDTWLSGIVPTLISAVGPRGVVIVTWDEDDDLHGNHILTVFAGASVKPAYSHTGTVDHYDVLRTICHAVGIYPMGEALNATDIADIWATRITFGRLKTAFTSE